MELKASVVPIGDGCCQTRSSLRWTMGAYGLATEQRPVGNGYNCVLKNDSRRTSEPSLPCARSLARLGGPTPIRQGGGWDVRSHSFSFHSDVQPHQYRSRAQIEKAKHLLILTDL